MQELERKLSRIEGAKERRVVQMDTIKRNRIKRRELEEQLNEAYAAGRSATVYEIARRLGGRKRGPKQGK